MRDKISAGSQTTRGPSPGQPPVPPPPQQPTGTRAGMESFLAGLGMGRAVAPVSPTPWLTSSSGGEMEAFLAGMNLARSYAPPPVYPTMPLPVLPHNAAHPGQAPGYGMPMPPPPATPPNDRLTLENVLALVKAMQPSAPAPIAQPLSQPQGVPHPGPSYHHGPSYHPPYPPYPGPHGPYGHHYY